MWSILARNWGVFLARGILALVLGVLALLWPAVTFIAVLFLFGIYAFVEGVFTLIIGIQRRRDLPRWWAMVIEGGLGIATSVVVFKWPGLSALALIVVFGIWSIATGLLEIVAAIQLRREIRGEWLLGLSGLASVALGVLLIVWPRTGVVAIPWMIGLYGVTFGVLLVGLALRLHGLIAEERPVVPPAAPAPV